MVLERLPPYDLAAEESVIGAVLADIGALDAVRAIVRPGDFFLERHAQVFAAALAVAERGEPTTPVLVLHELRNRGLDEAVGGLDALLRLTNELPTAVGVEWHAQQVAEDAYKRRLISTAGQLAAIAWRNGQSAADIAAEWLRTMDAVAATAPVRLRRAEDEERFMSAQELANKELPPIRAIVERLLTEGAMILAGKPKLGKSLLALNLALAVAAGGRALGSLRVEQGDVLALVLEDGMRRARERLLAMLDGEPPPARLALAFDWPALDQGGVEQLRRWLLWHPQARLVVIDTLKRVRPPERGNRRLYDLDYEAVAPLADLGKQHRVSILIVHHTNKSEPDDPMDMISGSTGLTGAADGAMVMKRLRGEATAELHVAHRDQGEEAFGLRFSTTPFGWMLTGSAEDAKRSAEQLSVLRVIALAATDSDHPTITSGEIASELDRPAASIRRLARMLKRDGLIAGTDRGYLITDHGRRSLDQSDHAITPDHPRSPAPTSPPGDRPDRSDRSDRIDHPDRGDRAQNTVLCPSGCGVALRDDWCPICGKTFV